jgi:DNA-binding NarL/FixJ family response regulator
MSVAANKVATIRVFIVDDHALVREWLGNLLRRERDLELLGEAADPAEALAAITRNPPDVAVVDISLKQGSGLELIKNIRAQLPDVEIVVLSMHDSVGDVERAFRAGAIGYVMKRESTGQIGEAIRAARAGRVFANPAVLSELNARFMGARSATASPLDLLSDREIDVFRRLAAGESTRQIAEGLGVGLKTVQTYCGRMKEKLGLPDGVELQRAALRWHEKRGSSN